MLSDAEGGDGGGAVEEKRLAEHIHQPKVVCFGRASPNLVHHFRRAAHVPRHPRLTQLRVLHPVQEDRHRHRGVLCLCKRVVHPRLCRHQRRQREARQPWDFALHQFHVINQRARQCKRVVMNLLKRSSSCSSASKEIGRRGAHLVEQLAQHTLTRNTRRRTQHAVVNVPCFQPWEQHVIFDAQHKLRKCAEVRKPAEKR
mmetsp:Transcript_3751/g.8263  ORF Transcript_3751/g.8263 Transcript_3751/m.8263 type:complete len:200 (+) Transcript_3751:1155-1754(+)